MDIIVDVDIKTGYEYSIIMNPTITRKHLEMHDVLIVEELDKTTYMDDRYAIVVPRDNGINCTFYDKVLKVSEVCDAPIIARVQSNHNA